MNLRSDTSTLAAQQPGPFAGARPSEQSWSAQLRWLRAPAQNHPCDGDRGCSSTRIEEGSTRPSLTRPARPATPCPSLGGARPMLPGTAMSRAPSLHRGGRQKARRPRRESGDAPERGTRGGSSEGMAPRRHLTAFTGRVRRETGTTRASCKTACSGERDGAPSQPSRASGQAARVPAGGKPSEKANADRGDSLARRRIHGSRACPRVDMRCRDR